MPEREAARFDEALRRYAASLEALRTRQRLEGGIEAAHWPPPGPSSPSTAPPVGVGAVAGSRVISLPEELRDGWYGLSCGTAAGGAGEGGGGGGDAPPL